MTWNRNLGNHTKLWPWIMRAPSSECRSSMVTANRQKFNDTNACVGFSINFGWKSLVPGVVFGALALAVQWNRGGIILSVADLYMHVQRKISITDWRYLKWVKLTINPERIPQMRRLGWLGHLSCIRYPSKLKLVFVIPLLITPNHPALPKLVINNADKDADCFQESTIRTNQKTTKKRFPSV